MRQKKSNRGWISIREGKSNRRRIISLLQKQPLSFTEISKEIGLSQKTVSSHLKFLLEQDYIRKTVKGKKIVYEILEPKTFFEMQKDCFNELGRLFMIFESSLDEKTRNLFLQTLKTLKESIENPKEDAKTHKLLIIHKEVKPHENVRFTIQHDQKELESE